MCINSIVNKNQISNTQCYQSIDKIILSFFIRLITLHYCYYGLVGARSEMASKWCLLERELRPLFFFLIIQVSGLCPRQTTSPLVHLQSKSGAQLIHTLINQPRGYSSQLGFEPWYSYCSFECFTTAPHPWEQF